MNVITMKRLKIQLPIFLCLIVVQFSDPALAGSLKQLWNKFRYDNQRLDYYQPYQPTFSYLSPSSPSINYPSASLNNFNLMNPIAESSNLHRTVVSLPPAAASSLQQSPVNNLQNTLQNSLQSSLPTNNAISNLMTSESISNQNFAAPVIPPVLPTTASAVAGQQQFPSIQHLSPEFLYDFGQKPNGFSYDSMRNLNNLQAINSALSLGSLTPLLLLSSLGTLSHKSLGHHGYPLTSHVPTSFLRGLTSYLSSYLPSSPRQRKRQIDRNLPPMTANAYSSLKKMTPMESFVFHQHADPLIALSSSQPKSTVSSYDATFKKYSRFNKKKPVKYVKPKWIDNKMKKSYGAKKPKNQIKYSKLMNESGFVNRQANATGNNGMRFNNKPQHQISKRPASSNEQMMRYSEPDKLANENGNKQSDDSENKATNQQTASKQPASSNNQEQTDDQPANRSVADQNSDKTNEKAANDKSNDGKMVNERSNEKLSEESTAEESQNQQHSVELTSNQPQQTDNLENFAEQMYSKLMKRNSSTKSDRSSKHHNQKSNYKQSSDDERDE